MNTNVRSGVAGWQKLMLMIGLMTTGLFLCIFAGCDQTPPPPMPTEKVEDTEPPLPTDQPAAENQAAEGEGEVVEEQAPKALFEYDATGRREPFKPLIADEIPKTEDVIAPPDAAMVTTPLQQFDVKQLKVTGIILGSFGEYAKIIAPDAKSYTVNIGTPVGKYEGQVTAISENAVIIREIIRYESGKIEEVETPLYLNPVQEE